MRKIYTSIFAAFVVLFALAPPAMAQVGSRVFASCGSAAWSANDLQRQLALLPTGELCVNASVNASISGFHWESSLTPLAVTTTTASSAAFTAGKTVIVDNVGATNDIFCRLGPTATTAAKPIKPGTWMAFTSTSETVVACITATGTSTANIQVGTGLATGAGGSGSGGGGAVTVADGADVNQGAIADASVTAGAAGSVSAKLRRISADIDSIKTNTSSAVPAGEQHIGEVGNNQIRVLVAQTVTAASAYTSGNAVGGKMTVAGAARVSGSLGAAGTGGILQQVVANSKSVQTAQIDVFIFDADPTTSTCTDKTAFVLATADFDKVIGVASIPGTPANNSGWFSGGTGSVGQANSLAMVYDLASATSLFACAVVRGTPTFTTTSDISFKFQILRN